MTFRILAIHLVLGTLVAACGSNVAGDEPDHDGAPVTCETKTLADWDPTGALIGSRLVVGDLATIYEPSNSNQIAAMVHAGFSFDARDDAGRPYRHVMASFSQNDDTPGAEHQSGFVTSRDGGETFGEYSSASTGPPGSADRLSDGRIFGITFRPLSRSDQEGTTTLILEAFESVDNGKTWSEFTTTIITPTLQGGLGRVGGRPVVLADNTILLPYYAGVVGSAAGSEPLVLASTDLGRNFHYRSSVVKAGSNQTFNETALAQLPDGSIYAVFRNHLGSALGPLLEAFSSDAGETWTPAKPISVAIAPQTLPAARIGINPQLRLMPSGVLVLSSGRHDNWVAIAPSPKFGNVSFEQGQVTYVNYPRATTRPYGNPQETLRVHGSSGNTGLIGGDDNRLIQFGDNCAASWGCPDGDSNYHVDGRYRIWRRLLGVAAPQVGKIDLQSKLAQDQIRVSGNMDWSADNHPRVGVTGAFDGSTDRWSSAIAADQGGELILELDQKYAISRFGVLLSRSSEVVGTVSVSIDGTCWSDIAQVTSQPTSAMMYVDLDAPVEAQFVRVTMAANEDCEEIGISKCALLHEFELYSLSNSFENEVVGGSPRGYETSQARVIRGELGSSKALELRDVSDSAMASAIWRGTPNEEKTLEFLFTATLPNAFLFGLQGRDENGNSKSAYHFAVRSDGSIAHYDDERGWLELSAPAVVATDRSRSYRLRIHANLDSADIFLDGELVNSAPIRDTSITLLDGHNFSSSGTAPVGDVIIIDDVDFQ